MPPNSKGLKVGRKFTKEGENPFEKIRWKKRNIEILNIDGSTAFEMRNVNLPENLRMLNVIFDKCYAIDRNFDLGEVIKSFDSDEALSLLMGNDAGK